MGLDDVISTQSAFVAAATAAVFSPRTRETIRKGAVIGVAGALRAGDVVAGAARGVAHGVRGPEPQSSSNGTTARAASSSRRTSSGRSSSGRSSSGRSSSGRSSSGRSSSGRSRSTSPSRSRSTSRGSTSGT